MEENSIVTPDEFRKELGLKPKEKFVDLNIAHFSMQFSDGTKAQEIDARRLFSRDYDWITGTEAADTGTLLRILRVQAARSEYAFHAFESNWIAIHRRMISRRSLHVGGDVVVPKEKVNGIGSDLNVCWAQFTNPKIGDITVLASHYATAGKPDAKDPARRVNLKHNISLARAIGQKAREEGKGKDLAFYGGDQNVVDRDNDTFFGAPLTSAWDELEKYQDTGHGNIDVIASYDHDKRVEAKYIRALDDDKFKMFTDHYPVEAGYRVHIR